MATYIKKPEVVDAVLVYKVSDHPSLEPYIASTAKGKICNKCGLDFVQHMQIRLNPMAVDLICPATELITRENGKIEYLTDKELQAKYVLAM